MPTDNIDIFYRNSDLTTTNNVQSSDLYSSTLFDTVIGKVIADINISDFFNCSSYDTYSNTSVVYYLKEDSSIFYKICLQNKHNGDRLLPGFFIFKILGGCGKYVNATGNVYVYISDDLVRNIKLIIDY